MHAKTALPLLLALSFATSGPAFAEPSAEPVLNDSDESDESDEVSPLERLTLVGRVLRVHFRSQHLLDANFGASKVHRSRPEVRARVRFPITQNAVGQIVGRFRNGRYDISGGDAFRGQGPPGGDVDEFYAAAVNLGAAHIVDFMPRAFDDDEVWSILGDVFWRSRWEPDAFGKGMTGGGSLALGYTLSDRLRLVLGITFESRLGASGVRVRPTGSLRWMVNDRLLIRSRGLGAQVEYAAWQPVSVFAAVYRSTSKFVLDRDVPLNESLVFRDRPAAMLGAGFTWHITKHFRLVAEGGAAVGRTLGFRVGDSGWISTPSADPHGYLEFRLIGGR